MADEPGCVDVVFDGPPGPESGRFVECEDGRGQSACIGEWLQRDDGMWTLRIPFQNPCKAELEARIARLQIVAEAAEKLCTGRASFCSEDWAKAVIALDDAVSALQPDDFPKRGEPEVST